MKMDNLEDAFYRIQEAANKAAAAIADFLQIAAEQLRKEVEQWEEKEQLAEWWDALCANEERRMWLAQERDDWPEQRTYTHQREACQARAYTVRMTHEKARQVRRRRKRMKRERY